MIKFFEENKCEKRLGDFILNYPKILFGLSTCEEKLARIMGCWVVPKIESKNLRSRQLD